MNTAGRCDYVVVVQFEDPHGNSWRAVGGGATLDEAIAFARQSAPEGHDWNVRKVADVYGV